VHRTSPSAIVLIIFLAFLTTIQSSNLPAQQSDDIKALQQKIQQCDQAGKYAEALTLQRRLAAKIEKAESTNAGNPGTNTANALSAVAWYALLTRNFKEALAVSNRAHVLAPTNLVIETNRAHALLLSGRGREARSVYLTYRGRPISLADNRMWEDVIADDVASLRKAGVRSPALEQISAELGGKGDAGNFDLTELNQKIQELDRTGNYKDAQAEAEKYVTLVRLRYSEDHPKFAMAISWLGRTLKEQGRLPDAEPLYERALAIDEKALGPDHTDVSSALNEIAMLYQAQGRYTKAEPLLKRALAIREKALGPDHNLVGQSLNNLAELYQAQGRYADAEPLFERGLAIDEKALGPEHPDVGTALNNLAGLYDTQGRYADAEPLYKRALAIDENALGPDHPDVGTDLNNLAGLYRAQGRYAEAEPLFKRALAIDEKTLGPEHPDVGMALNNLAGLYDAQGRYADAEPLYKRALAIAENADQPHVGTDLNNLAGLYRAQGRYTEAEPLYKRALAIAEKTLTPEHPDVGMALNNLALLYSDQGRNGEAEPLFKRGLAIDEKALGPDHPYVGTDLNNLAELYRAQGRYSDAEPLLKRALAIAEKAFGPEHRDVSTALNNLAELYVDQDRYAEAEPLMKRALAIREKALGPEHPDVGTALVGFAGLYRDKGRYEEAEPLMKRALAIAEKALGPDHPDVANRLHNLADLYRAEGRYAEAEPLFKRALAIDEKALGPEHPTVGIHLNKLAEVYRSQGRYADAEPLYRHALGIAEKALGPEHPDVGTALNNLAELYRAQGRYAEAEPLYKRALAIAEKAFGTDSRSVGAALNNVAALYGDQGRYTEAEPLLMRALAIAEKAFGTDHPDVGTSLNNLAVLYFSQSNWSRAADYWRSSAGVTIRRAQRGTLFGEALTGTRKSEAEQLSSRFWGLVKVTHRLASQQGSNSDLQREMFQTAQWAQSSQAAQSLAQMAARGAKGDSKLAALVRERQDLVAEWQRRDQVRSAEVARAPDKRNLETEAANTARLAAIDARIAIIDKELAANFPDYAALASPTPLSVEDVQAQLADDEALVLFLDTPEMKPTPEETFIWVVTKNDAHWVRSDLGTLTLQREVAALRCGLDYQGSWTDSHCSDLLKVTYTHADHDVFGKPLPFDLARAHALYQGLFGQIEDLIKNKRLLIVPSGPLTQIPFQVLVTESPKTALPNAVADYRDAAWLARDHAITVLPAVSSLKALRALAKESHASETFIGFGDPLLDGEPTKFANDAIAAKLARDAHCLASPTLRVATSSDRGATRAGVRANGGLADVTDIRSWAPLPETADELCDVAQNLGVDPATHLYLGATATETEIKRLSTDGTLAKYKIIHLATHGAVAGELSGTSEPGLILTPPDEASEIDDGYLSASEIAALKLDADWVILSACNTAAGDTKEAEALSGLARAFFYAGARSLLVSHWEVASESTVKLITKAIAELKADPKIGRAEALRRSMLSLIKDGKIYEAHPAFWAPFVLVGEGGAAR
jgi:tetratricopeptide (TPR) repeat protein